MRGNIILASPMNHACKAFRFGSAVAFALFMAASPAQSQGRSIVGKWALKGSVCQPIAGAISIGPLGITGDDMQCDFKSVVRVGDTVTWKGTCGFPEDNQPATVVAQTKGELLELRINGGVNGPYRRCRSE